MILIVPPREDCQLAVYTTAEHFHMRSPLILPPPACLHVSLRDRACIHSWDICNEPRNRLPDAPSNAIAEWVHDAAGFVKMLDSTHPVTVGSEGFFGPAPPGGLPAQLPAFGLVTHICCIMA